MPGSSDRPERRAVGAPLPRVHVLVSETEVEGPDGMGRVGPLLERAGPLAVHLRARLPARRLYELAAEMTRRTPRGSWSFVSGRPDIAVAAGARGVQLGRGALGAEGARRVARASGRALWIGVSVHRVEEAVAAARSGADHLVLGTIYRTPSHPGRRGRGPGFLSEVAERLAAERFPVPILAIGGVTPERIPELAGAGARGVVVRRSVWGSEDPAAAAASLRRALEASIGGATEGTDVEGDRDTRER